MDDVRRSELRNLSLGLLSLKAYTVYGIRKKLEGLPILYARNIGRKIHVYVSVFVYVYVNVYV